MARKIVVNGRFLGRRVTGVERYGREVLRCLGGGWRLESTRLQGWKGHAWEQFVLPAKLDANSSLWSPANTGPLGVRQQALTIHDLSPLEHPEWFRKGFATWYRLFLPWLARRVRRILVPSEYVKQKVIKHLGAREVTVIPNGVDHSIFHPTARQRIEMPGRYVLFVGTLEPRKNLNVLLDTWEGLSADFKGTWLVIAGASGKVFRSVKVSSDIERVCFPGYVDDEALAGLYANASVFVLPSREEGFGLPALEAMACGAPVIVSDGGALPEVVGEAGVVFSLSEPTGLSDALRNCLSDADLRLRLREQGLERAMKFPWQTTAESVWKCLNEL